MIRPQSFVRTLLLAVLLLFAGPALADLYVGPNCPYKTIQLAIDDVKPGFNIGVVPGTYNELLNISNKGDLVIYGNVNIGCGAGTSGATIISGAGHNGDSVVTVGGESYLSLADLTITDGNEDSSGGHGGGIDFGGHGELDLFGITLTNNFADYGGGLDVTPDGPTDVVIHANTFISGNTAGRDGGGIHIDGPTRLYIHDPQTLIYFNHAPNGKGGGIDITGPARADIGSPGYAGVLGVIYGNDAQNGGGISAVAHNADNEPAVVRLFTTDPNHPVAIQGNTATNRGGAVYLKPFSSLSSDSANAALCAYNFRILGNFAVDGAAIYEDVDTDAAGNANGTAQVYFNVDSTPGEADDFQCNPVPVSQLGGVAGCADGVPCNEIAGNGAVTANGDPTDGSTIVVGDGASFYATRAVFDGTNRGGHLLRTPNDGNSPVFEIHNCLITGNEVTAELLFLASPFKAIIDNCTIAHNTIGADHVIRVVSALELSNSIIAEDNKLTLDSAGAGQLQVAFVLSNDLSTLPPGCTGCRQGDPGFVNAAAGDYHLRLSSPAIDRAPKLNDSLYVFGNDLDLDGRSRSIDLAGLPNPDPLHNPRDLGAYEVQSSDVIFTNGFE